MKEKEKEKETGLKSMSIFSIELNKYVKRDASRS